MKIMRKLASVFLVAVIAMYPLVTAGCHKARTITAFDVPSEFDMSREYEITFWAKNDTNVYQTAIYNQAIKDFEALYPNIHVNMKLYSNYINIYNDVITNIATNTTPNVCITYPDHIATYKTGENVVVPLDDLINDKQYGLGGSELLFDSPTVDEVIPQFMDECSIGGIHYAIPYMRSTEACYVNKDFVEKLGYTLPEVLTWDFIWEVSDAAMKKDGDGNYEINGQKTMIPFIYKSTDNMMITMLRQLDAGYSTPDGEINIFNDSTTDILDTVAKHAGTGSFSTFAISGYPANFLNAGQCIFAVDSTAGATWMGTGAPNVDIDKSKIVDFDTVVYPVPQYDTENMQMISQGPSVCVFNKEDPQEVLASWIFAQYLITNPVQIAYAQTEGYVPVTSKAQNDPAYVEYLNNSGKDADHYDVKIAASKLLLENVQYTFTTPVFNGSTSLREAAGALIENTTKSIRRHGTFDDEFVKQLYDDVNAQYRLDQIETEDSARTVAALGPMPKTSVILLTSLGVCWLLIGAFVVYSKVKGKNR
ncbi:MAG: extracellular solute-binding protein [Saccharofermentans sp.]|nr:extracellular solute-binding protein [Saccharofermentans sp.]